MALQTKSFSVSGKSADGTNTFTFILRIRENSVNQARNTSNVTVQAFLKQSQNTAMLNKTLIGISFSLGSGYSGSRSITCTLSDTEEKLCYEWEGDIRHENNGACQLAVSGKLWVNQEPKVFSDLIISNGTMVLTNVQINNSVGASDAMIGSKSTIVLPTAQQGITYSLQYTFGSLTGYIRSDGSVTSTEVRYANSVISFSVPTSFYTQIPNSKSGECRLLLRIYQEDQLAATGETGFTVRTNDDACKPTLLASVVDSNSKTIALTGDKQKIVRYCSIAYCQTQAEAKNSATIKKVTVNGQAIDGLLSIPNVESGVFTFTATDSRGYTANKTVEKTCIPYVKLTCNAAAVRTGATTGGAELTVSGNCWNGNFGAADNTLTLRYRVGGGEWVTTSLTIGSGNTYKKTIGLEGLDYTCSHRLEAEVTDRLSSVTATTTLQRGLPVFDWGADYFNFHVPVHFEAGATGLT